MGYSMAQCGEIRHILAANHINYTDKVVNPLKNNGGRTRGGFGESANRNHLYYIYVHKKDYEWACQLIRENRAKE